MYNIEIFKAYDIRGIYPSDFDEDFAYRIGMAYPDFIKEILEQTSLYLGQGIASLINIFDPEIVILSGGIKETGQVFLNMIKKQVKKYVALPKTTPIEWTKLKHPGILGAGLLMR